MIKSTVLALALVSAAGLSVAPAQAALSDAAFSPDGAANECMFVAEYGGYVCNTPELPTTKSLSDLGDKTRPTILFFPGKPVFNIPKKP